MSKGTAKEKKLVKRLILLVKGALIGTGFLLPGVSGGALAAIFGLYGSMITFLAHPFRNFKQDVLLFLPVALGMLAGIILLSYPLSYFMENFLVPATWFFIGAIAGTLPSLWRESGKKGRRPRHFAISAAAFAVGYAFLFFGDSLLDANVLPNFGTWVLAGVVIALGILLPGFSPSNLLLYLGLYDVMVNAVKHLDLLVLLPIVVGGLACVLLLSRLVHLILQKAYTGLFHVIFGFVIASTVKIVPIDFNYLSLETLLCVATCAGGAALGYWMSGLEARHKHAEDKT